MKSVTIIAGNVPRDAVVAAALRVAADRDERVEVLYHQPIHGLTSKAAFSCEPAEIADLAESFVYSLSADALPALKQLRPEIKKSLGAEGLAQHFCTHPTMALAFARQAGGDVVPEGAELHPQPLKVAFWVAGNYLVQTGRIKDKVSSPLAFFYTPAGPLLERGGPSHSQGVMVLPCWSKRLTKVGEAVRLACMSAGYSGLVFAELVPTERPEDQLQIQKISFGIPHGFLPAFLALLDQPFDKFLYSIWKGNLFSAKVHNQAAVALRVEEAATREEEAHSHKEFLLLSPLLSTPTGWTGTAYHTWRTDYDKPQPTHLPEELWVEYPTAQVKLDGFVNLAYTLKQLEEQRIILAQRHGEVTASETPPTQTEGEQSSE